MGRVPNRARIGRSTPKSIELQKPEIPHKIIRFPEERATAWA